MWTQLKEATGKIANAVWCHRMVYAGLAAAYGAGCAEWIDKENVALIATACYVALVVQRGH